MDLSNLNATLPNAPGAVPSFRDFITFHRQTLSDQDHPRYGDLMTSLARLLAANDEKPVDDFYSSLLNSTIFRTPPNVFCPTIMAAPEELARMRVFGGQDWRLSGFHRALEERNAARSGASTLSSGAGVRSADMLVHALTSSLAFVDVRSDGIVHTPSVVSPALSSSPIIDNDTPGGHPHLRIRSEPVRPVRSYDSTSRRPLRPPAVPRTSPRAQLVEWRLAALVADFKFGPAYHKLLCQVTAYLEQHNHLGGTFLGGVFRKDRFARVLLLRPKIIALEITREAKHFLQSQAELITDAEKDGLDAETRQFLDLLTHLGVPFGRLGRLEEYFDNLRDDRISPPHLIGHVDAQGAAQVNLTSITAVMDFVEMAVNLLLPLDHTVPLPVIPKVGLGEIGELVRRHFANALGVVAARADLDRMVDVLRFGGKSATEMANKQSGAGGKGKETENRDPKKGRRGGGGGKGSKTPAQCQDDSEDVAPEAAEKFDDIAPEDSASNPDEGVGTWVDLIGDCIVVLMEKDAFEAVASGMTSIALSSIDPPFGRSSREVDVVPPTG